MPELVPVVAKDERMRRPRQDDKLAVRVGQFPEEIEEILLAGDPVVLAGAAHALVFGHNRHQLWHTVHAFLTMPPRRERQ